MDMKKIGLIALVVVAVGLLAWSFKNSFLANSVPTAGADQAAQMKAHYQQMQQQGQPASSPRMGGGHSPSGEPAGK
jgi:hypothetical protein